MSLLGARSPGRFVIGAGGLTRPKSYEVKRGFMYGMGASSSPHMIYVTSVTEDHIKYKNWPFDGRELVIARWIGEDLIRQGTETKQRDNEVLQRQYGFKRPIAVKINPRMYKPVRVFVVATVPAGKTRETDPWYWAEEYGGVGARETSHGYEYNINTSFGDLRRIRKDKRFKVVRTEAIAPRGDR
jgi:hypothetical protein